MTRRRPAPITAQRFGIAGARLCQRAAGCRFPHDKCPRHPARVVVGLAAAEVAQHLEADGDDHACGACGYFVCACCEMCESYPCACTPCPKAPRAVAPVPAAPVVQAGDGWTKVTGCWSGCYHSVRAPGIHVLPYTDYLVTSKRCGEYDEGKDDLFTGTLAECRAWVDAHYPRAAAPSLVAQAEALGYRVVLGGALPDKFCWYRADYSARSVFVRGGSPGADGPGYFATLDAAAADALAYARDHGIAGRV